MPKRQTMLALLLLAAAVGGCVDPREKFGKTFYLDGAGNWGFGIVGIVAGLEQAGYRGKVETFLWTTSFNPALDQINRPMAHWRAAGLAGLIDAYLIRYPQNDVNIIALSAGTGVALWAVENIRPEHQVNNVVLVGSSLSHDYDIRKAAKHIRGKIYVYYSRHDAILQGPVRALGTIDGKLNHDAAGLTGLHPPAGPADKVVNIGWSSRYIRDGWTGAHTDATDQRFVRRVLSRHIVGLVGPPPPPLTIAPTRRSPPTPRPTTQPVTVIRIEP